MVYWTAAGIAAAAVLLVGSAVSTGSAPRQQAGISRTDLQRHDLNIAGREAIQVRVDFAPGAAFPRHRHPGEELVYVLKGTLEYRIDGQPPVTLRAGQALFVPAGVIHAARNVGDDQGVELATYIVEAGKPLVETVP
jgi:quercetin dioxygenase-like cupin family protein